MFIRDLMTKEVRSAGVDEDLATIASRMWSADCGCIPIVDRERRPIAMITDRDICMAALTTGMPLSEIPARAAMSRSMVVVNEADALDAAETLMRTNRVRRLPVVDRNGVLVGILSMGDIIARADVSARRAQDGLAPTSITWTLAGIGVPWTRERAHAQQASP